MAGDWIKFRKKLTRDGRVLMLSRTCRANRATVLGALVILWSLADEYAERDGRLPGYTPDDIDEEVGLPGFCDAMPSDWMEVRDNSVYLPNYQEHNGDTAKRRAENTMRQKARRAGGTVSRTCRAKSATREEKRREEKIEENPPNPPQGGDAAQEKKSRRRTGRDDLFDAIVELTGADPKTAGSGIGKVVTTLLAASPPYTPDEVRKLPEVISSAGLSFTITFSAIPKYIGWTRTPPPRTSGAQENGHASRGTGGSVGPTSRVRAEPGKYDGIGIVCNGQAAPSGQPPKGTPSPAAESGGRDGRRGADSLPRPGDG